MAVSAVRLAHDRRLDLSALLHGARNGRSAEWVARAAAKRLREMATDPGYHEADRAVWAQIEITLHHVYGLERAPAEPLGSVERRGRLLAIATVLGVDLAEIRRIVGAI